LPSLIFRTPHRPRLWRSDPLERMSRPTTANHGDRWAPSDFMPSDLPGPMLDGQSVRMDESLFLRNEQPRLILIAQAFLPRAAVRQPFTPVGPCAPSPSPQHL